MDLLMTIILAGGGIILGLIFIDRAQHDIYNKRRAELKKENDEIKENLKKGIENARKRVKEYQDAKKNFINRANASRSNSDDNNGDKPK